MILPLIMAGIGLSLAGPALQKAVLGAVEKQAIGKASGIYNVFRLLGGAVGTAVAVVVFYRFGATGAQVTYLHGFEAALGSAAGLSFLGISGAVALKKGIN